MKNRLRVLFLTNNEISLKLADWLKDRPGEEVIVMQKEISKADIESCKPDFVISYNYRHIIKQDLIEILKGRIINLHISFLPWNKGSDPNAWSFLENTPKGVSIHLIDQGIDTGEILIQKKVQFNEGIETLASTYQRLNQELRQLFIDNWGNIKSFNLIPKKQLFAGSSHKSDDFKKIMHILGDEGWDIKIPEFKSRYISLHND
ncbi:MAG: formyltransferase family protein [Candidatus Parcubacteria bacterium]|nr:formyltransferase family protein [Candidatus Parcubacteria bacterium]